MTKMTMMTNPTPVNSKCSNSSSTVEDYDGEIIEDILAANMDSRLDLEQGSSSSQTLNAKNYQNDESFSDIHRVPTTPTSELLVQLPSSSDPVYDDFAALMCLREHLQGSMSSSQYPQNSFSCAPRGPDVYFHTINHSACNHSLSRGIVLSPMLQETVDSFIRDCKFLSLASDAIWSHRLQRIFSLDYPEVKKIIVKRVSENVNALMESKHGKHLFIQVIESCNAYQKQKIVMTITSNKNALIRTSIDRHGSYSVRKLIQAIRHSNASFGMTSVLSTEIGFLVTNQHGKTVINHCLIHLDARMNKPLYEALVNNCIELAMHKVGCSSLYFCIRSMPDPYRNLLLHVIADNSVTLARHPSGNYVVQHVLEQKDEILTQKICYLLQGQYMSLSKDYYSSHVVEVCLKSSGIDYVIQEFISCGGGKLVEAAKDQFGNYVIQKALQETKRTSMVLHQRLVMALEPHLESLQSHPIGRNVCTAACLLRGYSIKAPGMSATTSSSVRW